jgi:hypothetical protein
MWAAPFIRFWARSAFRFPIFFYLFPNHALNRLVSAFSKPLDFAKAGGGKLS